MILNIGRPKGRLVVVVAAFFSWFLLFICLFFCCFCCVSRTPFFSLTKFLKNWSFFVSQLNHHPSQTKHVNNSKTTLTQTKWYLQDLTTHRLFADHRPIAIRNSKSWKKKFEHVVYVRNPDPHPLRQLCPWKKRFSSQTKSLWLNPIPILITIQTQTPNGIPI